MPIIEKWILSQERSYTMVSNRGDMESLDWDRRKALSERAMKLAMSLPDDITARKNLSEAQADFISAVRDFAASCALAHTWSESEMRSRYEALRLADAAFTYAYEEFETAEAKKKPQGPGAKPSCTSRCNTEKSKCRKNCDKANGDFTCYLDCRLTFVACLAACINKGGLGWSGGEIIY
jgi:hypothetical protein